MCAAVNPGSKASPVPIEGKQTVEIRSADGSANVYLLIAALAVACRHGWEMENALEIAQQTYVDVDIHRPENATRVESLKHLPISCSESADALKTDRSIYEMYNVFSPALIDHSINSLNSFDENIATKAKTDIELMSKLVNEYLHSC